MPKAHKLCCDCKWAELAEQAPPFGAPWQNWKCLLQLPANWTPPQHWFCTHPTSNPNSSKCEYHAQLLVTGEQPKAKPSTSCLKARANNHMYEPKKWCGPTGQHWEAR